VLIVSFNLSLPLQVTISASDHRPKFQGCHTENAINRLDANGIQLEQSFEARQRFHKEIADAVASVFASPWRWLVWTLMSFFR